jgi:hypothetical protein
MKDEFIPCALCLAPCATVRLANALESAKSTLMST